jgi:hypothetical protein
MVLLLLLHPWLLLLLFSRKGGPHSHEPMRQPVWGPAATAAAAGPHRVINLHFMLWRKAM